MALIRTIGRGAWAHFARSDWSRHKKVGQPCTACHTSDWAMWHSQAK